jgi:hypothetical protein
MFIQKSLVAKIIKEKINKVLNLPCPNKPLLSFIIPSYSILASD